MIVGFLEINLASKYVYVHICNRFWASPRVPPEYNYNKKLGIHMFVLIHI